MNKKPFFSKTARKAILTSKFSYYPICLLTYYSLNKLVCVKTIKFKFKSYVLNFNLGKFKFILLQFINKNVLARSFLKKQLIKISLSSRVWSKSGNKTFISNCKIHSILFFLRKFDFHLLYLSHNHIF